MKLKSLYLLCLAFGFINLTSQTVAQAYKSMLAQLNEWHFTTCYNGCLTDVYHTDSDTIVNNKTYSILDGYHYINRNFLLREDIPAKKVYLLVFGIGKQDNEYLLYDFSLLPGDSVMLYNPISPFPDTAGYFLLDSIVPKVLIDGDTYRHYYLTALDPVMAQSNNAVWIEGIGSLSLINSPGGEPDISHTGALSCFFNNLTLHYSNLDSITGCIQVHTDLNVADIERDSQLKLYPNPGREYVQVNSGSHQIDQIDIFSLTGQRLMTRSVYHQNFLEINLKDFPQGYYLVKVTYDNLNSEILKLTLE